jgi:hypothetical protein
MNKNQPTYGSMFRLISTCLFILMAVVHFVEVANPIDRTQT